MTHSDVFHYDGLVYWGPLHPTKMEGVLDLIRLSPGDRVLDVGCGRAELLIRLIERYQVSATGLDRSSAALDHARAEAASRTPTGELTLVETDATEYSAESGSLACVSWLGGPYIGDSFSATLATFARWLRPGGYLLVGHGFWARQPDPDYLAATGIPQAEFTDHWGNVQAAGEHGLTLLYTCVSNRDEWDTFESRIHYNFEQRAAACPDDEALQAKLPKRRAWCEAQQRWGRDTMGFGVYLFRT